MNFDEAVVVRTYASEAEASIAASRLGSEGIGAHIQKDDCGGAYPALQMSGLYDSLSSMRTWRMQKRFSMPCRLKTPDKLSNRSNRKILRERNQILSS